MSDPFGLLEAVRFGMDTIPAPIPALKLQLQLIVGVPDQQSKHDSHLIAV